MSDPDSLRTPRVFGAGYDLAADDLDEPLRRPPPRRAWRWLLALALVLFLTPPAVVLALRWLPVPTTAFMLQSPVQPVQYQWVPAARMPEALRRAVVAAEDQKFWHHRGFDFEAIEKALEHNRRHQRVRGASTITQQVAKNLFLWPSRSYLRKGLEVTFTVLLELLWPKERILEVYLNVAEFGPGVYGAQAAGRRFFGKDAAQLSPGDCAQLAAVLPNPRKWRAGNPGPYVRTRTDWILGQLGQPPRYAVVPADEPDVPGVSDVLGVTPAPADEDATAAPSAEETEPEAPAADDEPSAYDELPPESSPEEAESQDAAPDDEPAADADPAPPDADMEPGPEPADEDEDTAPES